MLNRPIVPTADHRSAQPRNRWVECADARHATADPAAGPGDVVATLCRKSAAVVVAEPGRYAPECPDCDRQWRADEGIPQRETNVRTSRPGHERAPRSVRRASH